MIAKRISRMTNTLLYSLSFHNKMLEVLIEDQGANIISEVKLHTFYKAAPLKIKKGRSCDL
jgi:hypothetical protein